MRTRRRVSASIAASSGPGSGGQERSDDLALPRAARPYPGPQAPAVGRHPTLEAANTSEVAGHLVGLPAVRHGVVITGLGGRSLSVLAIRLGVLADVTGSVTLIWRSRRAAPARPVTSRGGPRRDRGDPHPGHRQRESEWLGMPGNSAPAEEFTVDVTTGNARAGIPIRNCAYRPGRTRRPTAQLGSRGR